MAKFGHYLVSGIIWILIAIAVALFGVRLTGGGGFISVLGWLMAIFGSLFASASVSHLWNTTKYQLRGVRMMRADPEGFARLRARYEEVCSTLPND